MNYVLIPFNLCCERFVSIPAEKLLFLEDLPIVFSLQDANVAIKTDIMMLGLFARVKLTS